jgi:hypothetical protein
MVDDHIRSDTESIYNFQTASDNYRARISNLLTKKPTYITVNGKRYVECESLEPEPLKPLTPAAHSLANEGFNRFDEEISKEKVEWFSDSTLKNILFKKKVSEDLDLLSREILCEKVLLQAEANAQGDKKQDPLKMRTYYLLHGIFVAGNLEWLCNRDIQRVAIANGASGRSTIPKHKKEYRDHHTTSILQSQLILLTEIVNKEYGQRDRQTFLRYYSVLKDSLAKRPEENFPLSKRQRILYA